MAKLRSAGFEITAVHNHLMEEIPKVLYLHYMGHGAAAQLATALRAALSVSKTPLEKPAAAESALRKCAIEVILIVIVGLREIIKIGHMLVSLSTLAWNFQIRPPNPRQPQQSRGV
jgi:hypothetical protein